MEGMLEIDSFYFDPVRLFLSQLDVKLPGKTKTLRERVDEGVVKDAQAWAVRFEPLAFKEKRANDTLRDTERSEAVLEETRIRAGEMCAYITAVVTRHPDLKDDLRPRKGTNAQESLESMEDMRSRCDEHGKKLKDRGIVIKFDAAHSTAAVKEQAAKHRAAQEAIELLGKTKDASQDMLVQLRTEGRKLRTRINEQVAAAIPGDRATQVLWGFSERETPRAGAKEEGKTGEKKAAAGKGDGKDGKKKAGTSKDGDGKDAEPKSVPEITPPAPGAVASGTTPADGPVASEPESPPSTNTPPVSASKPTN